MQTSPYREPDHRALAQFATHVTQAETSLRAYVQVRARYSTGFHLMWRGDRAMARAWEAAWAALAQARAIVVGLGRAVPAFDELAERSADFDPRRVTFARRSTGIMVADAIDHLRAAVPEIVVPRPPKQEIVVELVHDSTRVHPMMIRLAAMMVMMIVSTFVALASYMR